MAENPGTAYNPLFIYGQSGLGKTHLLHSIANRVKRNHPSYRIMYIKSEDFVNELIGNLRRGADMQAFRDKYRNVDLFLMDDVQFVAGRAATQEELFHTFNSLYELKKQIVFTSDRPPKEIKSLEDRLRTRFEWGLTADIQPPDFETRVAIITRKAALLGMELPEEVCEFIAKRLKNNIRQLEGAVKKLSAYRSLSGIHPTIGAAQNAIKDINDREKIKEHIKEVLGYKDELIPQIKITDKKTVFRKIRNTVLLFYGVGI